VLDEGEVPDVELPLAQDHFLDGAAVHQDGGDGGLVALGEHPGHVPALAGEEPTQIVPAGEEVIDKGGAAAFDMLEQDGAPLLFLLLHDGGNLQKLHLISDVVDPAQLI